MAISSLKLDFLGYIIESGSKRCKTRGREKGRRVLHYSDKRWQESGIGQ